VTIDSMTIDVIRHDFRLYRSGWSGDEVPWGDNQLWAEGGIAYKDPAEWASELSVTLDPQYGSAASLYRVYLAAPLPSPEDGWVSRRAQLIVDNIAYGWLPLSWYAGSPSDWPSGLARYPDRYGPQLPGYPYETAGPRGVWTLAVWRSA
jgi:hypothetical protein